MVRCMLYFLWAVVRLPHDLFHSLYRSYLREAGRAGEALLYRIQALVAVGVCLLNLVFLGHLPDRMNAEYLGSELAYVAFIDYLAWTMISGLRRVLSKPDPAPSEPPRTKPPSPIA